MESTSYYVKWYKWKDTVCWRKRKIKPDFSAIMQGYLLDEKITEAGMKQENECSLIKIQAYITSK